MPITKIEQQGSITSVYCSVSASWSQKIYLFSDVHLDSAYCNRELYLKHLQKAKKEGAWILDGGDLFDAMQGRFDPRRNMDELRPEYRRADYYDFVVEDVANILKPYADNFLVMAQGNHESAVTRHASISLTDRLVYQLRHDGSSVVVGGFKGWIRIVGKSQNDHHEFTFLLRYSHSGGGGNSAPVTRGVIDTNRQAVYLPDAQVVWNGHNHQGWIMPISRERVSVRGVLYQDIAWFVRTPGYKCEYIMANRGYEAEKARGPNPLGCIVITLRSIKDDRLGISVEPLFDV